MVLPVNLLRSFLLIGLNLEWLKELVQCRTDFSHEENLFRFIQHKLKVQVLMYAT